MSAQPSAIVVPGPPALLGGRHRVPALIAALGEPALH
jgi:hypothetical protein